MADHSIIQDLEDYAARRGVTPGTVCSYAFGQFRRYEHLKSRLQRLEEDETTLRTFMAANPPREVSDVGAA